MRALLVLALAASGALAAPAAADAAPVPPGPATRAAAPLPPGVASYDVVPAQVYGDVAVGMPTRRTVKVQHRDPATGAWDAPSVLFKARGRLTCGGIEGQASPGGVALLVECDRPYYEEDAPTRSVALVSTDGRTWARNRLRGEAYRPPAVSPAGRFAAWPLGGGEVVVWSAAAGFADPVRSGYAYDPGTAATVVDDDGTVHTVGSELRGRRCVTAVRTRTLAGATSRYEVPGTDDGCGEGGFEALDALTVVGGGYETADRFTLTRADQAAPFTLTGLAPSRAPGLVRFEQRRRTLTTVFVEVADPTGPLVAIGGPDKRTLQVQVYDPTSQTWGAPRTVAATRRPCRTDELPAYGPRELYVATLRCGRSTVVAASVDAAGWTVSDVGRRPWALNGAQVALPDATGTTVLSTAGVQRFAATTQRRCDVVWPAAPGALLRLHGRGRWPREVQQSSGGAFTTVSTAPWVRDTCRSAEVDNTVPVGVVFLSGPRGVRYPRFALREGTWTVRYTRDPYS